jgi:hypothetical protein
MTATNKEIVEELKDWRAKLAHIVQDLYTTDNPTIVGVRKGESIPHMEAYGLAEELDSMEEGMCQLTQALQPEAHNDMQCPKYNEPVLLMRRAIAHCVGHFSTTTPLSANTRSVERMRRR